jgi:hypothetical protein
MKVRTQVCAGQCGGPLEYGVVIKAQGNGYYASIRGQDGLQHFANYGYTQFEPNNQPVWWNEQVRYSLVPQGYPNAGKIACVLPA